MMPDQAQLRQLITHADVALYAAKESGRKGAKVFRQVQR